jgi:hypothetical protein
MNYELINNILAKKFTKYFPKTINRKLLRRYNVFFVPTKFNLLPKNFYPIFIILKEQFEIVNSFNPKKKLIKFNTKIDLDKFLKKLFKRKKITYLDVGGDNIDLYLKLNNILNIKKYFIYNFKQIIDTFREIKKKFKVFVYLIEK